MNRHSSLFPDLATEADFTAVEIASKAAHHPVPASAITFPEARDAGGQQIFRLVQRVFLSGAEPTPRQVVFCGVDEENSSSSICARVGQTLAELSARPVCLIDANSRTPNLGGHYKVNSQGAFAESSQISYASCAPIGRNLWLADPETLFLKNRVLLATWQLKKQLDLLRESFEYVLIDASGVGASDDAVVLGQAADAAILVIEADATRRMPTRKAIENLQGAGVRLLGSILSNRSFPIPQKLYDRL